MHAFPRDHYEHAEQQPCKGKDEEDACARLDPAVVRGKAQPRRCEGPGALPLDTDEGKGAGKFDRFKKVKVQVRVKETTSQMERYPHLIADAELSPFAEPEVVYQQVASGNQC